MGLGFIASEVNHDLLNTFSCLGASREKAAEYISGSIQGLYSPKPSFSVRSCGMGLFAWAVGMLPVPTRSLTQTQGFGARVRVYLTQKTGRGNHDPKTTENNPRDNCLPAGGGGGVTTASHGF